MPIDSGLLCACDSDLALINDLLIKKASHVSKDRTRLYDNLKIHIKIYEIVLFQKFKGFFLSFHSFLYLFFKRFICSIYLDIYL